MVSDPRRANLGQRRGVRSLAWQGLLGVAATHFRQLAEAINAAFGRWDLGHLYVFRLPDGLRIGTAFEDPSKQRAARTKIAKRLEAEVFDYEFDFGDSREHRCTVLQTGVIPEDAYGVRPKGPVAVWGWGMIPDQYGRTTPEG
ncbi:MAG: IS1096 element passenger TnpR family protein [Actinomycetota bacterium]